MELEAIASFLHKQLSNDMLIAVAFAAVLAAFRKAPLVLWSWAKRQLVMTVDVSDHDQAFFGIQKWLSQHAYTSRARMLTVTTRNAPVESGSVLSKDDNDGEQKRVEVTYSPAPGHHLIRVGTSYVLLGRERREVDHNGNVSYRETITFQSFSRDAITRIITEAQDLMFPPGDESIAVHRAVGWHWRMSSKRQPRALASVVLDAGVSEDLLQDLERFFSSEEWYQRIGIPYQRGYLLEGPPGNGKTSLVLALATKFRKDIYILNLGSVSDEALASLMAGVPPHSFVLIEDVDCNFTERTPTEGSFLTLSGFLNSVDGVSAPTGRVLFMTTNEAETLDPAIVRPGRADRTITIDVADHDKARRMFLRFFPGEHERSESFGTCVQESMAAVSMADVQEHLIRHRDDPERAVQL